MFAEHVSVDSMRYCSVTGGVPSPTSASVFKIKLNLYGIVDVAIGWAINGSD